jgi:hypothetical protein
MQLAEDCHERELIKAVLCSIWCSRGGLHETDLLAVVGEKMKVLQEATGIEVATTPRAPTCAWWPPVYFHLGPLLEVGEGGRLRFAHLHARDAVERRYLDPSSQALVYHRILSQRYLAVLAGIAVSLREDPDIPELERRGREERHRAASAEALAQV